MILAQSQVVIPTPVVMSPPRVKSPVLKPMGKSTPKRCEVVAARRESPRLKMRRLDDSLDVILPTQDIVIPETQQMPTIRSFAAPPDFHCQNTKGLVSTYYASKHTLPFLAS